MDQHPLAISRVTARTWPFFIDLALAGFGMAVLLSVISTGIYWLGKPLPVVHISSTVGSLPV